jgi:D-amino peptidase
LEKIYIIADMEGISGIVTQEQVKRGTPEYAEARHLLARDVNAAIEGAFEAGCKEVIVNDAHSSGFNFPMAEMDPRAEYVTGGPRRTRLFGLDDTCDAVVLVGYHAMAGTPDAVMDHTMSSANWRRLTVDGLEIGEIGMEAMYAGHFGVPVIFVSGDAATVAEARALLGPTVETVRVKDGHARTSARCIHPVRAHAMIREGVKRAASQPRGTCRPYLVEPPLQVVLETLSTAFADSLEKQGWERVDGRTVTRTIASATGLM